MSDTYTLMDEVLTPMEAKFERLRRTVGLVLGPALFFFFLFFPIQGVEPAAAKLAAVLALTITWWICEPIPLPATALLAPSLCVALGISPAKDLLASFADPIIFIFIGSFMLARAMTFHGLDRRFALTLLASPWVAESTIRVLFTFGAIAVLLSMWFSNTACTAMMLPIAIGILREVASVQKSGEKKLDPGRMRFSVALLLMTAYGASIGGLATPVGTPPNLIGIGFLEELTGTRITFVQWMTFALPAVAVMFVALFGLLVLLHPPEIRRLHGLSDYIRARKAELGGWTRGQTNTLIAFGCAVVFWTLPGFLSVVYGSGSSIVKTYQGLMPEGVVAIFAAMLLFVLPVNWRQREFTITWAEASRIDWGTVYLFGAGIALGSLGSRTGLADYFGRILLDETGLTSLAMITLVATGLAIIISELTSNTAAATVVIPVVIAICKEAGVDPVGPAVGACLGASYGFMLPVSTAPNAMVYGTGYVPITRMVRAGILFDIIGLLVIWCIVMFLVVPFWHATGIPGASP